MTTPPSALTIDAARPQELARFWAALLGWYLTEPAAEGAAGLGSQGLAAPIVRPPAEDGCEFDLVFVAETEPKRHKNRLHLDLASRTPEHQREVVERALSLGARYLDLGQSDVPWVVLADPQGNEFCVLEPRPEYAGSGALAALVVDTDEPARLAGFWSELIGWPITADQGPQIVGLRSLSGRGPTIEFLRSTDAKQGRNRLRFELAADAGAEPLSPKRDPEGNEFSLRTQRGQP
ncbi:VOC family protein [Amycolatopsis sp. NPDC049253]|uniref:VOC family protein n=1 Tax=Amycolatopsis sp. NPDC049253 TaxID=3155274 RepID=UPI003441A7D8